MLLDILVSTITVSTWTLPTLGSSKDTGSAKKRPFLSVLKMAVGGAKSNVILITISIPLTCLWSGGLLEVKIGRPGVIISSLGDANSNLGHPEFLLII
jgi:hypothetical protein